MPTDVIRTIGPGSTYASANAAWQAAIAAHTDLVAADERWIFEGEAFTDAVKLDMTGTAVTTDATRNIIFRPQTGVSHGGARDAGFKVEQSSIDYSVDCDVDFVTFQDMGIGSGATNRRAFRITSADCQVLRCVLDQPGADSVNLYALLAPRIIVRACLVFGGEIGLNIDRCADAIVQHNTVINSRRSGIYYNHNSAGTVENNTIHRVDASPWNVGAMEFNGGTQPTLLRNNGTTGQTYGTGGVIITDAAFVDFAGGDYSPAVSGPLDDAGRDLSAQFDYDILGNPRNGSDIGCYDNGVGGGSAASPPIISNPQVTVTGPNSADFSFDTDEAGGAAFIVATLDPVAPADNFISSLLDRTGAPAESSDFTSVATVGEVLLTCEGLQPATEYHAFSVHRDADDEYSNVLPFTFTTDAAPVGATLVLTEIKNKTGSIWVSQANVKVFVFDRSDGSLLDTFTGQTVDAQGQMTLSSANLPADTVCFAIVEFADGKAGLGLATTSA